MHLFDFRSHEWLSNIKKKIIMFVLKIITWDEEVMKYTFNIIVEMCDICHVDSERIISAVKWRYQKIFLFEWKT